MTIIYNFDGNRIYTGITREIGPDDGISNWWTDVPPPEAPDGKFASFLTPGWVILDSYPHPEPPQLPAMDRVINKSTSDPMVI
jgi:hypothetical protein